MTAFLYSAAVAPFTRLTTRRHLWASASIGDWAYEFNSWLTDAVTRGDRLSLLMYQEQGPYAERAHPYPDHFIPLLVVFGAAGDDAHGTFFDSSGILEQSVYSEHNKHQSDGAPPLEQIIERRLHSSTLPATAKRHGC
jgi:hypothetical protein